MAKQDLKPPPWLDSMSDGCTCVKDRVFGVDVKQPCVNHDEAYHMGGGGADRLKADKNLCKEIHLIASKQTGWRKPVIHTLAEIRYIGVRVLADRHFNKLGPGM